MGTKPKIMIVDDAEINRELLIAILGDGYEYVQAENGREALHILGMDPNLDLMLLDINMPEVDGFQVLEQMESLKWNSEIPVIMISSEEGRDIIEHAYIHGAQDYIARPFEAFIVRRRVQNILKLYRNQRMLRQMVYEQIYEKEENNNLMISVLSHVVEFRNSESGEHILHIRTATELLLRQVIHQTDEFKLTETDIATITTASALHDIGKINIPEEILNKPGRLTREEFEIMKTHTTAGADIIRQIEGEKEKPLLRVAWEICRWHHERWDGRGYPDGLKGEEIPIAAQVVALADVYDALTSKRCYKDAYDHETALSMILNGECGSFNPFLLDCLKEVAPQLRRVSSYETGEDTYRYEADRLAAEIMQKTDVPYSDRGQRLWEFMQEKLEFFASLGGGMQFSYDVNSGLINVVDWNEPPQKRYSVVNIEELNSTGWLGQEDIRRIKESLESAAPENREVSLKIRLSSEESSLYRMRAHTLWSEASPEHYVGVVGQLIPEFMEEDTDEREYEMQYRS